MLLLASIKYNPSIKYFPTLYVLSKIKQPPPPKKKKIRSSFQGRRKLCLRENLIETLNLCSFGLCPGNWTLIWSCSVMSKTVFYQFEDCYFTLLHSRNENSTYNWGYFKTSVGQTSIEFVISSHVQTFFFLFFLMASMTSSQHLNP